MNKIGFIGAGNMASAIIKGIYGQTGNEIAAYDLDQEKVAQLSAYGVKPSPSPEAVVAGCKYVVLAVKPQNFPEILPQLKGRLTEETVIVSIAAGITADYLKSQLDFPALKVVLVMPNTPLLLGEGASALARVEPATEEEFAFVCGLFASSGRIAVIPQDKMNEIIPVNGSSPAFIYEIAKHFIACAEKQGIEESVALPLFSQALIGSAKMMTDSGYDLDTLIQMVSSKGGTTIAGLESFRRDDLGKVIENACDACIKRAYELTQ